MRHKTILIYPYNQSTAAWVRYLDKHQVYQEIRLFSTKVSGIVGKTADIVDLKSKLKIVVEDVEEWDWKAKEGLLFLADGEYSQEVYESVRKLGEEALNKSMDVTCEIPLDTRTKDEWEKLAQKNECYLNYIYREESKLHKNVMDEIPVPVIGVGEMINGLDGIELCFSFREILEEHGYHTLIVSNEKYSEYMGCVRYPEQLWNSGKSPLELAFWLNRFFCELVKAENCDVLIIHFPYGMLEYNEICSNGYGVCNYVLAKALRPDYFAFSVLCISANKEYYNHLSEMIEMRYGMKINILEMSNKRADDLGMGHISEGSIKTVCVKPDVVEQCLKEIRKNVFSCSLFDFIRKDTLFSGHILQMLGVDWDEL